MVALLIIRLSLPMNLQVHLKDPVISFLKGLHKGSLKASIRVLIRDPAYQYL